jgi:hypothetical protein
VSPKRAANSADSIWSKNSGSWLGIVPRSWYSGLEVGSANRPFHGHTSLQMSQPKADPPNAGRSASGTSPRFSMVW